MPAKKDPVTIKKYANRRLYNTGTSIYVTLEDLAQMVRRDEEFVVQDAKTGEDITHSVLTQIIFELENNKDGQNLLPISFLRQMITYYGDQMETVVPSFLEQSMQVFATEQVKMREQMQNAFGGSAMNDFMGMGVPLSLIEEQTRRNIQIFQDAFRMFSPAPQTAPQTPAQTQAQTQAQAPAAETSVKPEEAAPAPSAPAAPSNNDLQELRDQLAAMQSKIESLSK